MAAPFVQMDNTLKTSDPFLGGFANVINDSPIELLKYKHFLKTLRSYFDNLDAGDAVSNENRYKDKAIDYYNQSQLAANQQPRPKGTGYVVLIRCLYSGFNTFFKRPKGRGIKPLNTNKITREYKNAFEKHEWLSDLFEADSLSYIVSTYARNFTILYCLGAFIQSSVTMNKCLLNLSKTYTKETTKTENVFFNSIFVAINDVLKPFDINIDENDFVNKIKINASMLYKSDG